ncbi:acyltransferase [Curtobacterium flaccumfaciens pv. flaccumfaciens]|nr:acyltransferase [Curtobacterium flaccumfaciens pv. flaccumfaciens]
MGRCVRGLRLPRAEPQVLRRERADDPERCGRQRGHRRLAVLHALRLRAGLVGPHGRGQRRTAASSTALLVPPCRADLAAAPGRRPRRDRRGSDTDAEHPDDVAGSPRGERPARQRLARPVVASREPGVVVPGLRSVLLPDVPFLIRLLRRAHPAVLAALAVLAAVLVLVAPVLVPHLPGSPVPASWPPARFPEFLLGVLTAALVRSGAWRGPRLTVPVLLTVAGLLAADLHPTSGFALTGCTVVGFSLLLPALARADAEGRSTGLSSPLLVRLGTRSFAFYLVHLLTIDAVLRFRPQGPAGGVTSALLTLLALVVALAVATVLHDAVEVPARRLLLHGLRNGAARAGLSSPRVPTSIATTPSRP